MFKSYFSKQHAWFFVITFPIEISTILWGWSTGNHLIASLQKILIVWKTQQLLKMQIQLHIETHFPPYKLSKKFHWGVNGWNISTFTRAKVWKFSFKTIHLSSRSSYSKFIKIAFNHDSSPSSDALFTLKNFLFFFIKLSIEQLELVEHQ